MDEDVDMLAVEIVVLVVSPNQQKVDCRSVHIDRNEQRKEGVDDFGRMTRPTMNETRRDHHHSSSRRYGNNHHSRDDIVAVGVGVLVEIRTRKRGNNGIVRATIDVVTIRPGLEGKSIIIVRQW